MTDRERMLIEQKLKSLQQYQAELEPYLRVSHEKFEKEKWRRRATERLTQIIVECAIDANRLLIEALEWFPADHARDSFLRLHEHKVLDEYVTIRYVKKYVELRNIIVHLYEKVDAKDLFYSARRLMKDSEEYARQIQKFLNQNSRSKISSAH